jgi:NAD(P)-dependent dehydrogenase (short-subunit alcohol dehydrogenase family)
MAAERGVLAVTGGASGIGLAIAEAALGQGWRLAVADRDAAALARAAARLGPGRATGTELDVTDEAAVDAWITAAAGLGPIRGLVTAAGIAADIPALDTPADRFRRILDVNVTGTFLCARAAGRAMRDHGAGGAIVTIASVSGLRGGKGRVAYGASKAAVINLTQVLAVDLARHGIRANAICPGPVETPMVAAIHGPEVRQQWLSRVPMRRYAQPAELAGMTLALLDDAVSGYVTGQAIAVDAASPAPGSCPRRIERNALAAPARRGMMPAGPRRRSHRVPHAAPRRAPGRGGCRAACDARRRWRCAVAAGGWGRRRRAPRSPHPGPAMADSPSGFWTKLAAVTAFLTAVAGVGGLLTRCTESPAPAAFVAPSGPAPAPYPAAPALPGPAPYAPQQTRVPQAAGFCCDFTGMRRCPLFGAQMPGAPCFCPGQGTGIACP